MSDRVTSVPWSETVTAMLEPFCVGDSSCCRWYFHPVDLKTEIKVFGLRCFAGTGFSRPARWPAKNVPTQ